MAKSRTVVNPLMIVPEAPVKVVEQAASSPTKFASVRQENGVYIINLNMVNIEKTVEKSPALSNAGINAVKTGIILHEVAHIKYKSLTKRAQGYAYSARINGLSFWIWNVLEDSRIEYHLSYDFPSIAIYLKMLLTFLKLDAGVNKTFDNEFMDLMKEEIERDLDALYDLVRFGKIPNEDSSAADFIQFALPLVTTSTRGSANNVCDVVDTLVIWLENKYAQKMNKEESNFAQNVLVLKTGKSEGGMKNDAPPQPIEINEDTEIIIDDSDDEPAPEQEDGDAEEENVIAEQEGVGDSNPYTEDDERTDVDDEIDKEIEENNKEILDELAEIIMDDDKIQDEPLKDLAIDSAEEFSAVSEEELEESMEELEDEDNLGVSGGDSMLDMMKQASEGDDPLPEENQMSGGDGAGDGAVLKIEKNDIAFYRSTIAENEEKMAAIRRAFLDMFRDPDIVPFAEGDINIPTLQNAYINSLIGEEGPDFILRRIDQKDLDVVILRDISGSIGKDKVVYAKAVVLFMSALEGIDGIRTCCVDFDTIHDVVKSFDQTLVEGSIVPISRGGTAMYKPLVTITEMDWRANSKILITLTDGGVHDVAQCEKQLETLARMDVVAMNLNFGYRSAQIKGLPNFNVTIDKIPEVMASVVKSYVKNGKLPTDGEINKEAEQWEFEEGDDEFDFGYCGE